MKPQAAAPIPSKTARKAQSAALQDLGEQLLRLPETARTRLALPERLIEALDTLAIVHTFEGRRRQSQYVGKLMRRLSAEQVDAIAHAVQEQQHGSAAGALRLHTIERWRYRLVADDAAVTLWVAQFPQTDVQQLRALIRQVRKDRKDQAQDDARGTSHPTAGAPRKTRSWRLLFQFLAAFHDQSTQDSHEHPV